MFLERKLNSYLFPDFLIITRRRYMLDFIKGSNLGLVLLLFCFLVSACGPSPEERAPTPPADLIHLIPSDFTAASYFDMKYLRENSDLNLPDHTGQNFCAALASPENVDEVLGLVLPSTISADSGIQITAVTICRGNFDEETIMEQDDYPVTSTQKYKGFELSIFDLGSDLQMTSTFLDETTWVLSMKDAGVKAVIDYANSLATPPFADLGAALTDAFIFTMMKCEYEACTAHVHISLTKGSEGPISMIQLYQFENAERAADALPEIRARQEEGILTFYGSGTNPVPIIGDSTTQEGRFIKIEGTIPVEDLPRMFE
jgi:hypothetical protein